MRAARVIVSDHGIIQLFVGGLWVRAKPRKRDSRVCSVDKANVLDCSQLWREVVEKVHAGVMTSPSLGKPAAESASRFALEPELTISPYALPKSLAI